MLENILIDLDGHSKVLQELHESFLEQQFFLTTNVDYSPTPIGVTYKLDVERIAKALEEARQREKQRLKPIQKYHVKYRRRA